MTTLADFTESLERLLAGQSGVTLGLIIGGLLSWMGFKMFVTTVLAKIDEIIAEVRKDRASTNRLCRAVGLVLISSKLDVMRAKGREIVEELVTEEQQREGAPPGK